MLGCYSELILLIETMLLFVKELYPLNIESALNIEVNVSFGIADIDVFRIEAIMVFVWY